MQATRIYPGNDAPAVDALDLEIADGELMVLVGPSGSGKTTALRMLAGLEEVDAGAICIGERDVTDVPPKDRDVAMVFQNYALYPYLTVAANIALPAQDGGGQEGRARAARARGRRAARARRATSSASRRSSRAASASAWRWAGRSSAQPSVFLMDEPLSNLDAKLRVQMRADIAALQARLGTTTVYVTHDQAEAMTLGHRVAVLDHGRLQQCRNAARALRAAGEPVRGRVHRLAVDEPLRALARLRAARCRWGPSGWRCAATVDGRSQVVIGLRPESLELGGRGNPGARSRS